MPRFFNRTRGVKKLVRPDYAPLLAEKVHRMTVIRFETMPGHQARWIGQRVYAFTMCLGFSRAPFTVHTTSMAHVTVFACHVLAFRHFGTTCRERLMDDFKVTLPLPESFVTQKETL